MVEVEISNLSKRYAANQPPVLRDLSLSVAPGERFFLLGPSGCGKSTLLRIVAGLLEADSGTIRFNGREIGALPPEARQAPMVFQNYALWPNMTVAENVAFGLRAAKKYSAAEIRRRVDDALSTVRMDALAARRPGALSGGQQQRVALARCLALDPGVLLLDEPLSNLDARLRDEMRGELVRLCSERRLTSIYVTHDRREALSMADRAAVLHGGVLQQVAPPVELYRRPVNRFVAGFLGDANFWDATATETPGRFSISGREMTVGEVPDGVKPGDKVTLFCRPEAIRFGSGEVNNFSAELESAQFLGECFQWEFSGSVRVLESAAPVRETGRRYELTVDPGELRVLTE